MRCKSSILVVAGEGANWTLQWVELDILKMLTKEYR
jgi:hypothetical protein